MDRLSELPDSLILSILSLLPMTDVVPTMILSKRWLHLWETLPCLDFSSYNHPMFGSDLQKYIQFISGAISHWNGPTIQKFSLDCYLHRRTVRIIDSWLLFAITNQVEELHLRCVDRNRSYLPQILYSCSSIVKMSLSNFNLRVDDGDVQWNRLTSLKIGGSDWLLDDPMNQILAGAPLLEELIFDYSNFLGDLDIRSTSLRTLDFGSRPTLFISDLRIWAPNLLNLQICGCFCGTSLLLDVPSLTNLVIRFKERSYEDDAYDLSLPPVEVFKQVFRSIRHVEKLTISEFDSKTLLSMKHTLKFPNAKSLSFCVGSVVEMLGVLDMFPNLTTLCVQQDAKAFWSLEEDKVREALLSGVDVIVSHVLSKADLSSPFVPYLKTVEIGWYMRDVSIIPALEILLENATSLDKMVFRAHWRDWYGDKAELLLSKSASSPIAKVIIIHEG